MSIVLACLSKRPIKGSRITKALSVMRRLSPRRLTCKHGGTTFGIVFSPTDKTEIRSLKLPGAIEKTQIGRHQTLLWKTALPESKYSQIDETIISGIGSVTSRVWLAEISQLYKPSNIPPYIVGEIVVGVVGFISPNVAGKDIFEISPSGRKIRASHPGREHDYGYLFAEWVADAYRKGYEKEIVKKDSKEQIPTVFHAYILHEDGGKGLALDIAESSLNEKKIYLVKEGSRCFISGVKEGIACFSNRKPTQLPVGRIIKVFREFD